MGVVRADLRAQVHENYGDGVVFWARVAGKLLFTPALQAILLFRLASCLAPTPLRPVSFLLRAAGVVWAGADIHPDARIGPGLFFLHSTGIVIGGGVVVGSGCRISQGVTLGELGRGARDTSLGSPVVGDDVTIGVNAVVLGGCRIGDGAVVGANSVVTRDVPAGATVAGSPARVIREPGA
jgi:serine O-acetyltransferase